MAQSVADRRDVDFVLHEQLQVENLSKYEQFEEFNKKTIDMIISEARNLAIKEMLPILKEGDEEGCVFQNGTVTVPESFHKVFQLLREGEWIAMTDSAEWGGQEMPASVALAAMNYFDGANYPFMLHSILTHGAGKLVETFGTDEQKKLFLKNLFTGKWGGTMLLTEPEAGSDVGALTTKAVKNDDGTYSITGNKIFISSGETNLVENIIHPVLARIEGAPEGTAGISLFLVPKYWVNEDGSMGEFNDVVCTGIEEKMGIHGSPTCSLSLGSKGNCKGTLLGKENKGMSAMFVMMNDARLQVGMQGFACASASYMNALNYSRERIQGKSLLSKDKSDPSVAIISHPDVKRQLLSMKSYSEAMRSLFLYIGLLQDSAKVAKDASEKEKYQGLIDVLIPVAKGYVTDRAFDVCSTGVHIFGGYGFTKEYPQEQLLRDCTITRLYEGTNGIQAMDLLGRKLMINKGQSFKDLIEQISAITKSATGFDNLKALGQRLESAVSKLTDVAMHLGSSLGAGKLMNAFSFAHPFLDVTGDVIMAWLLLWRATVAQEALNGKVKSKDVSFYEGQINSCRFFINTVLPLALAKMEVILSEDTSIVDMEDEAFGSK